MFYIYSIFFAIILFVIGRFLTNKILHIGFYCLIGCVLFVLMIAGGGVINDAYERLAKFKELENTNQLAIVKKNLSTADGMFKIDLEQFKNSDEFLQYIHGHEHAAIIIQHLLIGFFMVVIFELACWVYYSNK